jgi:hypothetical protein
MPSSYTTSTGVTLSRNAFICHYVAAYMAKLDRPVIHSWTHALAEAERAWEDLERIKP